MKKSVINSAESLASYKSKLDAWFNEHKYLIMHQPQFGMDRTLDQNAMSFELYTRIGKTLYGGDTKHARYECKLHYGVPILREHDPDFHQIYDTVIKPHDYGTKLKIMEYLPVTSLMSKKQFSEFVDKILNVYSEKGVDFTDLEKAA